MNAYDIIRRPVITEQSMEAVADKKYVFMVDVNANKTEIKAAVEQAGYGFIDVTTHLRNDTGGLNPDCGGGDGIHVNKLGYYSMLTDVAKRLVADRH